MMTSTQVVAMSVSVIANSLSQDYTHLDDHPSLTFDMTPGFKPLREGTFLIGGGGGELGLQRGGPSKKIGTLGKGLASLF